MKLIFVTLTLTLCAFGQVSDDPAPSFILGTGAGFKPYQTPIKSGASAFTEGGMTVTTGIFAFVRVDLRATDAQMILEGCKSLYTNPSNLLMVCGGPGFGADASNIGVAFAGGGKWFFAPKLLRKSDTWLGIEIGVAKSTVPAPVTPAATISPVQPDFRVGIAKFFK